MPEMKDYYEPWTYNYANLTNAKEQKHSPVATAESLVSGKKWTYSGARTGKMT